ncbi:unnamed protein product [Ixodes pacificus]
MSWFLAAATHANAVKRNCLRVLQLFRSRSDLGLLDRFHSTPAGGYIQPNQVMVHGIFIP